MTEDMVVIDLKEKAPALWYLLAGEEGITLPSDCTFCPFGRLASDSGDGWTYFCRLLGRPVIADAPECDDGHWRLQLRAEIASVARG